MSGDPVQMADLKPFYLEIVAMGSKMLSAEDLDPSEVEDLRRKTYETGDLYRFEILKIQRQTRFQGQKMFIWMHNWHANFISSNSVHFFTKNLFNFLYTSKSKM